MRQPGIRLLDFHKARDNAASLSPILMRLGTVNRISCTISEDGRIDSAEQCTDERSTCNDLSIILLPASLQDHAISILHGVKAEFPRANTAIVLEVEEPDCVMELIRSGVDEFFVPPFRAVDILPRVHRLLERAKPEDNLIDTIKSGLGLKQLVGESSLFVDEMKKIPLVAKFNTQVLILGETGTGKELCARA